MDEPRIIRSSLVRVDPTHTILKSLGGIRAVARAIQLSPEAVSRWQRLAKDGGTGGFIPRAHWPKLIRLAKALGVELQLSTLAAIQPVRLKKIREDWTAPQRHARSVERKAAFKENRHMNRQKIKGDSFEREIAKDLAARGFLNAHRVPLSGAVEGYKGDVRFYGGEREWIVQCKISKTNDGRGFVVRFLHHVHWGKIACRGGNDFVAFRDDSFCAFVRHELPPIANLPILDYTKTNDGKMISQHIEGHDVLIFRIAGSHRWFAVVTLDTWRRHEKSDH